MAQNACDVWYNARMSHILPPVEDRIGVYDAMEILGYKSRHTVLSMIGDGILMGWRRPRGRKYILSRKQVEHLDKQLIEKARQDMEERRAINRLLQDI